MLYDFELFPFLTFFEYIYLCVFDMSSFIENEFCLEKKRIVGQWIRRGKSMEKLMDYDFVQSFQRQVYDDNF